MALDGMIFWQRSTLSARETNWLCVDTSGLSEEGGWVLLKANVGRAAKWR